MKAKHEPMWVAIYLDSRGFSVNVGRLHVAWWRRGAWVPFSVRTTTPEGRFGRFVFRKSES